MINSILTVSNISKVYDLKLRNIGSFSKRFLKAVVSHKPNEEFWALKNVSFELKKGECLGIVGKNGSGKSTLLSVICGITRPTTGFVKANGRITAMLELCAGFDPEFTGRENAYFKSILYGYSRKEIEKNFKTIEEFADIGIFMDKPVKTYSSGMYARLAFSVSISLNPDILVVDEALSVGDSDFKKKCFDRFEDLKNKGTSILFVSHSINQIKRICTKAIYLNKGNLVAIGTPEEIADLYLVKRPDVLKNSA